MPKMKSHKGAQKRFRKTKNGKIMRRKAYRSHLMRKKSPKRKRKLKKAATVDKANKGHIEKLMRS